MRTLKKLYRRMKANNLAFQLDTMSTELHACRTFTDAYRVIAHFVPALLCAVRGALFMRDNLTYKCVKTWGRFQPVKRNLLPQDCRALERMETYFVQDRHSFGCPHALETAGPYLCLPLMRAGRALGLLHLHARRHTIGRKPILRSNVQLAKRIARHCAQKLSELLERETLTEQAERDELTGLFNFRHMEAFLRRQLEVRGRRSLAVIMLDIDHFKHFNGRFTHSGGNALLQAFGRFLREHIRDGDVACRFGGEEFVVILPGAGLHSARCRAEQIRRDITALRVAHHDKPLGRITLSLGVAASKEHGSSAEELLQAAAKALRRAKISGRNRVAVAASMIPTSR